MKHLTSSEVNDNLASIFPDKNAICVHADSGNYIIDLGKFGKVAIDEKKGVFVNWMHKPEMLKEYETYCTNWKRSTCIYVQKQFLGETYIPLIWERKNADAGLKSQYNQFLSCVGYYKASEATELQRLNKLAGKTYSDIYKMIKEIDVVDSTIEFKQEYEGYLKYKQGAALLVVIHTKGKFSFQISKIASEETDEEIQNIFFRLLGMRQTNQTIAA